MSLRSAAEKSCVACRDRNAGDRRQFPFKVGWLAKASESRGLMEGREYPSRYPGPVCLYLDEGSGSAEGLE